MDGTKYITHACQEYSSAKHGVQQHSERVIGKQNKVHVLTQHNLATWYIEQHVAVC